MKHKKTVANIFPMKDTGHVTGKIDIDFFDFFRGF